MVNLDPKIIASIDAIRLNDSHGASQLARQAAGVLKLNAELSLAESAEDFLWEQRDIASRLIAARPAMAPVANIISRIVDAGSGKAAEMGLVELKRYAASQTDAAVKASLQAVADVVRHGAALISSGDRIATCSYSSAVMATLKEAKAAGKNFEVVVGRAGASASGEITARQLADAGIPVTFVNDTAIGLFISKVDLCFIGADRVCADGGVVNAVGSYLVALAARADDIPFYVLCETLKFDRRCSSSKADLEYKTPSQLIKAGRLPGEVKVSYPQYDITPAEMVTAIVTELGHLSPAEATSYMKGDSLTTPQCQ